MWSLHLKVDWVAVARSSPTCSTSQIPHELDPHCTLLVHHDMHAVAVSAKGHPAVPEPACTKSWTGAADKTAAVTDHTPRTVSAAPGSGLPHHSRAAPHAQPSGSTTCRQHETIHDVQSYAHAWFKARRMPSLQRSPSRASPRHATGVKGLTTLPCRWNHRRWYALCYNIKTQHTVHNKLGVPYTIGCRLIGHVKPSYCNGLFKGGENAPAAARCEAAAQARHQSCG